MAQVLLEQLASSPAGSVSGVRSSWEAVATNARRADSWRRSSRCIVARARARSPTSSRPSSRGVGASGPSAPPRTAAARRRARRRAVPVASAMPSRTATSSPTAAAARNARGLTAPRCCTSVSRATSDDLAEVAAIVWRKRGQPLSARLSAHVDGLHDDDLVVPRIVRAQGC